MREPGNQVKAGVGTHECHFFATERGFNENISFTFQAIQKPSAHLTKLCCGVFCKFLGDFWICLGGNGFSQRICKIQRNKKY